MTPIQMLTSDFLILIKNITSPELTFQMFISQTTEYYDGLKSHNVIFDYILDSQNKTISVKFQQTDLSFILVPVTWPV